MTLPISAIAGATGTLLLQRTFLLETLTSSGIPRLLFVIDAVTEENPEFSADITEHPVEDGPEVSDHIQLKNPTLQIKGTVSGSPIDLQTTIGNLLAGGISAVTDSQFRRNILNTGLQQAAGAAGASLVGGAAAGIGGLTSGAADALARAALLSAYERKARFDVITRRQRYVNMAIERLSFPRDSNTGAQCMFELELKRIRTVSTLSVPIDTVSESKVASASSLVNQGNQVAKGVTGATAGAATAQLGGL